MTDEIPEWERELMDRQYQHHQAAAIITSQIFTREMVLAEVRCWPHGNLAQRLDLSIGSLATGIIDALLEAGWTPPAQPDSGEES